jgi:hypothetical protein
MGDGSITLGNDFVPITPVAIQPIAVAVHPSIGVNSV